jgi:hypothetical protein
MFKRFALVRSLPALVWIAFVGSALLLVTSAFEWPLVDWLTPFLFVPLKGIVWLIFLSISVWSLIHLIRNRRLRRASLPACICAVAFAMTALVPFTHLWLRFNFALNKPAREQIVRDILEGRLTPDIVYPTGLGLISLSNSAPHVSNGGNKIETEKHDEKTYVFFFTFSGILSSYAGFLYVPTGGDPRAFSDLNEKNRTTIERYEDHWFFVSHRN